MTARPHRYTAKPRFYLSVAVFLAILIGISFLVTLNVLAQARREKEELNRQKSSLYSEIDSLREDISFAQTDEYVIRSARRDLGMIMEGEITYVNTH